MWLPSSAAAQRCPPDSVLSCAVLLLLLASSLASTSRPLLIKHGSLGCAGSCSTVVNQEASKGGHAATQLKDLGGVTAHVRRPSSPWPASSTRGSRLMDSVITACRRLAGLWAGWGSWQGPVLQGCCWSRVGAGRQAGAAAVIQGVRQAGRQTGRPHVSPSTVQRYHTITLSLLSCDIRHLGSRVMPREVYHTTGMVVVARWAGCWNSRQVGG
ncbi:hypothetical protein HaLaN_29232 [Haematococcus lacustris]|uniref:Uncharacterized protein n=1 Tax=Haematococcus lacustris TaxID=44745 RepID=A0A6A0ACB7_HAELA|nr:hypothetical protein HaLaN_29232 [Haematococcus lacustris]